LLFANHGGERAPVIRVYVKLDGLYFLVRHSGLFKLHIEDAAECKALFVVRAVYRYSLRDDLANIEPRDRGLFAVAHYLFLVIMRRLDFRPVTDRGGVY